MVAIFDEPLVGTLIRKSDWKHWDVFHSIVSIFVWSFAFANFLISPLLNMLVLLPVSSTFVFVVLVISCLIVLWIRNVAKVDPKGRAVLVTGCDTGFGHEFALKLREMGFRVFAGCLFPDGCGAMDLKSVGIDVIKLDVTSQEDAEECFLYVKKQLGEEGLWALVNNAGIVTMGGTEWSLQQDYEKVLAVNTFGTIRTTRTFLPLVRKAKGRVVIMSSMCGRVGLPCLSAYTTSKWALEGFGECLRQEMASFGVKVVLIEPGHYVGVTGIIDSSNMRSYVEHFWSSANSDVQKDYGGQEYLDTCVRVSKALIKMKSSDINNAVRSMISSVHMQYPRCRYQPGGFMTKAVTSLGPVLPETIVDWLSWLARATIPIFLIVLNE